MNILGGRNIGENAAIEHTKKIGCRKYWHKVQKFNCMIKLLQSRRILLRGHLAKRNAILKTTEIRQMIYDVDMAPSSRRGKTNSLYLYSIFLSIWVVLNVSFNHRLSTLKVDTQIYSQVFISRIRLIK